MGHLIPSPGDNAGGKATFHSVGCLQNRPLSSSISLAPSYLWAGTSTTARLYLRPLMCPIAVARAPGLVWPELLS
jgi:hypothetical protein